MAFRYYIDPETGEPHIHNHGVQVSEVEQVLLHPAFDGPAKRGARLAEGRTQAGRCLRVVYAPEPGGGFVITAHDLTGKALDAFRRRLRRRGKK